MNPIFVYDSNGKLVRIFNPIHVRDQFANRYAVYKIDDNLSIPNYEHNVDGNEKEIKEYAAKTIPNFGKIGPETELNFFNEKTNKYDRMIMDDQGSISMVTDDVDIKRYDQYRKDLSKPNLQKTYIGGPNTPKPKPVAPIAKPVAPIAKPVISNNSNNNPSTNMKQFFIYNQQGLPIMVFSKDASGNYQVLKTNDKGIPIDNQVETLDAATFEKRLADSYTIGAYTDAPDLDYKMTISKDSNILNPVVQTPSTNAVNNNAAPPKIGTKDKNEIIALQTALGMPEKDRDGKMGPKTKQYIEDYQAKNKLKKDGIAGKMTIEHLEKNVATTPTTPATPTAPTSPTAPTAPTAVTTPTIATPPPNQTTQTTQTTSTPTTPTTDANNDGVIDEKDVLPFVETTTPEIASTGNSPFTRRVTHGIWEPFGDEEEGLVETRTRPIKRIYTNPQRQDTSTATLVNEFLGNKGARRNNREDRRNNADNGRTRTSNDNFEDDDFENYDDSSDNRGGNRNDKKILEGKEKRERRNGPLIQNPMIDLAIDVVRDPNAVIPDFDNVRDARQFHRAVRTAKILANREDNALNREKDKKQRERDRISAIRHRTAERLGRTISSPQETSSDSSTPTTPTATMTPVIGDPKIATKQYPPLVENSTTDYNKSLTPIYDFQGQGVVNDKELVPEIQTKQFGGQIMQNGSRINPPLFDIKMPKQNNANWKFDGLDELPEYKIKDDASERILKNRFQTPSLRGQESQLINTNKNGNTQSVINNQLGIKPTGSNGKFGVVSDPINFIVGPDGNKQQTVNEEKGGDNPYWNSRKLNVFGNQMQHEANMYPVMYNVGKSLFDKAEIQNPIYNKQDVAYLQGMKRNQIAPNMNVLNDNREAMNQAIRGNARGSGQILNAYAANQNASNRSMNDEMYRIKNANQAQENNYLQALNQVGSNRREIDTLVDEKNRQHRLAFDKFQRDALESGEKAQINKGQMLNQELSDKITMDNYLNQIGKNFKYKLQQDGTYLLEFEDFSGNKRTMDPRQTKATMEILQKSEQDKLNANQAAANAQAGSDAKAQAIAAENTEKLKLQAIEEQRKLEAQQEARKQAELQRLADEEAKKKASGKTNKTGGYIYKRKSF